ncbi:type II TA system antitoxin MqsA family protein [Anaerobaca lacustris]|uniref:Type II toxin-antitoxin system MqsA family antitoxin n=1 Tax=Anaerobaca lacustris TaxID=3044600 RepID=A0AAW6TZ87_9BACT|nr:type II toxin-antitoxin system MqsA family antitoxin [Sedimentisphaerales bacterium M17dextr]
MQSGSRPRREKPTTGDICPSCGHKGTGRKEEEYEFPYGSGETEVMLKANVTCVACPNCGLKLIDQAQEEACHEAVCRHLGVMSPTQIRGLREMYRLKQREFAEVTSLGEATLSRWERGLTVQNRAYDNFLYLLGFEENMRRLRERTGILVMNSEKAPEEVTFRELVVTEEVLARQEEFQLRPCLTTEN